MSLDITGYYQILLDTDSYGKILSDIVQYCQGLPHNVYNSRIFLDIFRNVGYCQISSDIFTYCHIFSYIVGYCQISSDIFKYCHIFSFIVGYCAKLLDNLIYSQILSRFVI